MYIEALEVGWTLWGNRAKIQRRLLQLFNRILRGHIRIAVFGLGGTGKTTVGKFLAGKLTPADSGKYQLSYSTEEFRLQGELVCTLLVPGGQRRRIEHDWPELFRRIADGKASGIINVVSWGHHSFSDIAFSETKYFSRLRERLGRDPSKDEFVAEYLEQMRMEELRVTREMLPHLKMAEGKLWMVTLVTKQDLWWRHRADVRKHYVEGEYNALIEELRASLGRKSFTHEYVSASLVVSNLQTNDGTVLVPTAEGYDQGIQYANLGNVVRAINEFVKKQ